MDISPFLNEFARVAAFHAVGVASPGPDFAIVFQQSIAHGRRVAIWTSLGIATGIFFHVAYSLIGLGWLLKQYPQAAEAVKYVGAAYLAWIGVKALLAKPQTTVGVGADVGAGADASASGEAMLDARQREDAAAPTAAAPATFSAAAAFRQGLLVNVLNPKVALFFVAVFTSGKIVGPDSPFPARLFYGVWMAAMTAVWFSCVSCFFTKASVRAVFLRFGHWLDRVMGVILLALALKLALDSLSF
ncbi:MAG: LysE family translocator [Puniceicoccales bacterium]|jgi:threonine/homoserine/homoserine lactone efflux protein|nr:LysE family translocator [Puniceicoccales bacterium]